MLKAVDSPSDICLTHMLSRLFSRLSAVVPTSLVSEFPSLLISLLFVTISTAGQNMNYKNF